jgi:hypothetical protein
MGNMMMMMMMMMSTCCQGGTLGLHWVWGSSLWCSVAASCSSAFHVPSSSMLCVVSEQGTSFICAFGAVCWCTPVDCSWLVACGDASSSLGAQQLL